MKWHRVLALFDRPLRKNTIVAERYKIQSVIGMGSYGVTYVVNDLQINRYKVLKQLRQSKQRYESGRKSFEQEKMILQTLNHQAIPSLYDQFLWEKKSFFVMEYMPGENFEDYIFSDGRVYKEREVFEILYEILGIVSVFHSKGIIHRDLRIPNILMKENQISIIDLGLAKYKGEGDERATTYEGEQALMREVHFRSDFYALGHFSLFLLYAGYESIEKHEKPWYEELTLKNDNREILMRMLQIKTPYYENVQDLKKDIAFALERMETPCFKSF